MAVGSAGEVVRCLAHVIGDVATIMGDGPGQLSRDRAIGKVFRRATAILEAVLEIGNQAEPSGSNVAARRMQEAKAVAVAS
jgi:hypothetical protein